jgi:hypothetical protein
MEFTPFNRAYQRSSLVDALCVFCARTRYESNRNAPRVKRLNVGVYNGLWFALGWRVAQSCPHNPKVGGSNPPPATNLKQFSNQSLEADRRKLSEFESASITLPLAEKLTPVVLL